MRNRCGTRRFWDRRARIEKRHTEHMDGHGDHQRGDEQRQPEYPDARNRLAFAIISMGFNYSHGLNLPNSRRSRCFLGDAREGLPRTSKLGRNAPHDPAAAEARLRHTDHVSDFCRLMVAGAPHHS